MRVLMFYHSLLSDWNHGNAHFLRGVAGELRARGHDVRIYEPEEAWSLENLLKEHGEGPVGGFREAYPGLDSVRYDLEELDLKRELDGVDLVLVHEWSDHALVRSIGKERARGGRFRLLFHDTHHRAVTEKTAMKAYDLRHYDGVLAFGNVIRDLYRERRWARRAWTWHEAADIRVFYPREGVEPDGDLVWIGNWGDGERSRELREFLLEPVRKLKLKARVHGVRYPKHAREALRLAGIRYGGWLPNYEAPEVFARHRVTVHVPRRPYVEALPGIPTIRPFEALACGIPLVTAPWNDAEGLFTAGRDYLVARDGREMKSCLHRLLKDDDARRELAAHGLETIGARHTCAHRVDELMHVVTELDEGRSAESNGHRAYSLPNGNGKAHPPSAGGNGRREGHYDREGVAMRPARPEMESPAYS